MMHCGANCPFRIADAKAWAIGKYPPLRSRNVLILLAKVGRYSHFSTSSNFSFAGPANHSLDTTIRTIRPRRFNARGLCSPNPALLLCRQAQRDRVLQRPCVAATWRVFIHTSSHLDFFCLLVQQIIR
jgi:hypothetical protein